MEGCVTRPASCVTGGESRPLLIAHECAPRASGGLRGSASDGPRDGGLEEGQPQAQRSCAPTSPRSWPRLADRPEASGRSQEDHGHPMGPHGGAGELPLPRELLSAAQRLRPLPGQPMARAGPALHHLPQGQDLVNPHMRDEGTAGRARFVTLVETPLKKKKKETPLKGKNNHPCQRQCPSKPRAQRGLQALTCTFLPAPGQRPPGPHPAPRKPVGRPGGPVPTLA